MNKPKNSVHKAITVIRYVTNWPLLIKDKLIGGDNIVYKFRDGTEVECRTKSTDINEAIVVLSGIEYPQEICTLNPDVDSVVVDVGANISSFGIYISKLNPNKNFLIYAFEPHPGNSELAIKNLQRNGIYNFELIEKAISDINGHVKFDISGAYDAFRINEDTDDFIEVSSVRLSTFCHSRNIQKIDLLKMDIEGGEYDVFKEDIEFIKNNVDKILVEYHNLGLEDGSQILTDLLLPEFTISIQSPHIGGGMLIATRN